MNDNRILRWTRRATRHRIIDNARQRYAKFRERYPLSWLMLWRVRLKFRHRFTRKLKVGFGPVKVYRGNLGYTEFHIRPFVDTINRTSQQYNADIYFPQEDVSRFDVIVANNSFDDFDENVVRRLKASGKLLVYNIIENPANCRFDYRRETWFTAAMDGIITVNPLQSSNLREYCGPVRLIGTSVITRRRKSDYTRNGPVRIYWDGFGTNLTFTSAKLDPIIRALSEQVRSPIRMFYYYDCDALIQDGLINHQTWTFSNWESTLVGMDIGVSLKPFDSEFQQSKPFTKVLHYMAAGLPVVCTPSAADRMLIEHGRTGYFAYSDEEWMSYLKALIDDAALRERIGRVAAEEVRARYCMQRQTAELTDLLDLVIARAQTGR